MYDKAVKTVEDVKKFFRYLVDIRGVNFHPDTDFSEYVSSDTGSKTFTDDEATHNNSLMATCFLVCEQAEVDIYEIGLKFLIDRNRLMNEEQAKAVANALGGRAWQSGGDIWLVLFEKADGKIVVISDEAICEYANQEDFDGCRPLKGIMVH